MSAMIVIPYKRSSEVDLRRPLSLLLPGGGEGFQPTITEMNTLRSLITSKTADLSQPKSLECLLKYYDLIFCLERKIPVSDLQVTLKWKDSLKTSSFMLGSGNAVSLPSLSFEKACILFNIAAHMSQKADAMMKESLTNDHNLKDAAKLLTTACGIMSHLRSAVPRALASYSGKCDLTTDMTPDVLMAFEKIMLAQGQEAFFHKAAHDRMKDAIVARVAAQTRVLYEECTAFLTSKLKDSQRDWLIEVQTKEVIFRGLSNLFQGLSCVDKGQFGEGIARLTKSVHDLSRFPDHPWVKEYLQKGEFKLNEVRKDNDLIYHQRIPDINSLSTIECAVLAKPVPLADRMFEQVNPFEHLLNFHTQQAVTRLESHKTQQVNEAVASLKDATSLLNGLLSSLNLPMGLEDMDPGVQVPPSLLHKGQCIRAEGGLQSMEEKMSHLPELLTRNQEILTETSKMLQQEEDSDDAMRRTHGAKWTRKSSPQLSAQWRDALNKYRAIIEKAVAADQTVRDKWNRHRSNLEMLQSESGVILPSGGNSGSGDLDRSPCVQKLKQLMQNIEGVKSERDQLLSQLEGTPFDDMRSSFVAALEETPGVNEDTLASSTVGKVMQPILKRVTDNLKQQEELVATLTPVHEEFLRLKQQSNGPDTQREQAMASLSASYDAYSEIRANLMEGIKFYNDLTLLLVNMQNRINDYCFARKAEMDDLLKDIGSSASAPASPPARPPPPSQVPVATPQHHHQPPPPQGQPPIASYQPYYYMPPPLPTAYNPYGGVPMVYNTIPGYPGQPSVPPSNYPYPQQQPAPYPTYPGYPQQPRPN